MVMVALLLMLMGCGAQKQIPIAETHKDSVVVIIRDSVVLRDSLIYVQVPVEVIREVVADTDTSHIETSLAESDAWIAAGKLNHTLSHKKTTIQKEVTIPEHHSSEVIEKVVEKEKIVEVEVEKELSSWQNFLLVLGKIALAAVAVLVIIVSLKRFL